MPPATDATTINIVRFKCACGKGMQANAQFGGRLARCPACGENVIIPKSNPVRSGRVGPDEPTPIPKQLARKQPADELEDVPELEEVEEIEEAREIEDEEEEEDRPRQRRAAKSKKVNKSGTGRVLLWLTLTTLLLVLLGGGGALAWWLIFRGATDDLVFVPGDVAGFVTIRPAEIAVTPFGQKAIGLLPPAAKSASGPLPMAEVERMSIVFPDAQASPQDEPPFWVVIRSTKSLDKDAVLKGMGGAFKEEKFEGKTYFVPTQPMNPSVWFAGDKILVMGKGPALQQAMELPSTRTPGPLDVVLGDVQGNRHFVAAFKPPPGTDTTALGLPPAFAKISSKFIDTDLVTITADVADGIALDVSLSYASNAKANEAKGALDQLILSAKTIMRMSASQAGAKLPKQAENPLAHFSTLLDSIRPEQNGSAVTIRIAVDGSVVSSMAAAFAPKKMDVRLATPATRSPTNRGGTAPTQPTGTTSRRTRGAPGVSSPPSTTK